MIVKRTNKSIQKVETELVTNKKPNSVSTFNENNIDTKTYKDEVCEALDILDKEGINIYDPNNTPGMYLFNHANPEIPIILKHLLSKKINKQTTINNIDNEEKQIPNNLLQYLKNKKP